MPSLLPPYHYFSQWPLLETGTVLFYFFQRWVKWDPEKLSDLPKVSQCFRQSWDLISSWSDSKADVLPTTPHCLSRHCVSQTEGDNLRLMSRLLCVIANNSLNCGGWGGGGGGCGRCFHLLLKTDPEAYSNPKWRGPLAQSSSNNSSNLSKHWLHLGPLHPTPPEPLARPRMPIIQLPSSLISQHDAEGSWAMW